MRHFSDLIPSIADHIINKYGRLSSFQKDFLENNYSRSHLSQTVRDELDGKNQILKGRPKKHFDTNEYYCFVNAFVDYRYLLEDERNTDAIDFVRDDYRSPASLRALRRLKEEYLRLSPPIPLPSERRLKNKFSEYLKQPEFRRLVLSEMANRARSGILFTWEM